MSEDGRHVKFLRPCEPLGSRSRVSIAPSHGGLRPSQLLTGLEQAVLGPYGPANIKKIQARLQRNSSRSVRQMAAQVDMARSSVRNILKQDLKCSAFKRQGVQFMNAAAKTKRLQRCKSILQLHGSGDILFSDEKKWTVEEVVNPQNHRIYAQSKEDAKANPAYYVTKSHSPAHVMVWASICTQGKCSLVFLPDDRLTGKKYRERVLAKHVEKEADAHFGHKNWTFQQDGAPCHRESSVVTWLENHVPNFIRPEHWPPYSPDLNPLDYYLWSRMEQSVNTKRWTSVDALKEKIRDEWGRLDDSEVAGACRAFWSRVQKCVDLKGEPLGRH